MSLYCQGCKSLLAELEAEKTAHEKAERERDEARKAHRAAITRQSDAEWQARGIAECLGWDGQGSAVSWLGSQIDAARAATKRGEDE